MRTTRFVLAAIAGALGTAAFAGPPAQAQDGFGGWSNHGLVRHQARAGYVPSPQAFQVEGLLAEHHFPAREQRCGSRFCVLTAMGHGLHRASGERSAYLIVEPVSGHDPARFARPDLDLVIVIDRSGSMEGWKLDAAKEAAQALTGQLTERDRVSVVTFDDRAELHLAPRRAGDAAALAEAIESVAIRGGTNLHAGLSLAFAQAEPTASAQEAGRMQRVVLLTDERPNVGPTDAGSFLELVGANAARGVGLTIIGVGLDLGAELADRMAQVEGAAMHYLEGPESAEALFADLRRFVTPVAFGLQMRVEPGPGLRVAEVFGVPADRVTRHADGSATLRASTVFFDPVRRGAVVRLAPRTPGDDAALRADATVRFSYRLPEGTRMAGERGASHRALRADAIADFPSHGAYLAYALVSYAELLRRGLTAWEQGEEARAIAALRRARRFLQTDQRIADEPQLQDERDTVERILRNMGAAKR